MPQFYIYKQNKNIEFVVWATKINLNKHRIGYEENNENIILKPNTLEKKFLTSSNKNQLLLVLCGRNDHLNYYCSCKT